jgi:hypothetical protein
MRQRTNKAKARGYEMLPKGETLGITAFHNSMTNRPPKAVKKRILQKKRFM